MKITIKNQLSGKVSLCLGMKEYELEPGEEISAECKDGDCMYIDQVG